VRNTTPLIVDIFVALTAAEGALPWRSVPAVLPAAQALRSQRRDSVSSVLPPLVAPAAELTREEVARYSRHLIIPDVGVEGQRRLKNARVLVIGAGGLGSPTLLYLAAAGVGTIGIIEFDVVDESNLQRQIIHGTADVGRPKARSAAESIRAINPLVTVVLHEHRLDAGNAVALFEQYDLILDGTVPGGGGSGYRSR